MTKIIGVDPGSPLAIGVLDSEAGPIATYTDEAVAAQIVKTGHKTASWVNQAALVTAILENERPDLVVIERVGIRPNESLTSGVPFVGSMFLVEGICSGLGLRCRLVSPSVWKPAMGIKVSLKNPKEPARVRALEEWPDRASWFARKKDHNIAEALLLALYAKTAVL
jgi:crossover junction endodeoxyribonuclease RuvC